MTIDSFHWWGNYSLFQIKLISLWISECRVRSSKSAQSYKSVLFDCKTPVVCYSDVFLLPLFSCCLFQGFWFLLLRLLVNKHFHLFSYNILNLQINICVWLLSLDDFKCYVKS